MILNGNEYLPSSFTGLGYRNVFPSPVLDDWLVEAEAVLTARNEAQAAASSAAAQAADFNGTSTTSLTPSNGAKTATVATGQAWQPGHTIKFSKTDDAVNEYMVGTVTSYDTGTGSVDFTVLESDTGGGGPYTNWTVTLGTNPVTSVDGGSASAIGDVIAARRDTAANWSSNNPTLASGELGYESDTGRVKIGDNSTAWNSLLYTDQLPGNAQFNISSALNPSSGTITVSLSNLGEIKDILPTSDDTIDFTGVSTSKETIVMFRMTNGGAHSLSFEIDGSAATSVTNHQSFVFTTSGTDECAAIIDEDQNITLFRLRQDI